MTKVASAYIIPTPKLHQQRKASYGLGPNLKSYSVFMTPKSQVLGVYLIKIPSVYTTPMSKRRDFI